jgi:hypothetical protein
MITPDREVGVAFEAELEQQDLVAGEGTLGCVAAI